MDGKRGENTLPQLVQTGEHTGMGSGFLAEKRIVEKEQVGGTPEASMQVSSPCHSPNTI